MMKRESLKAKTQIHNSEKSGIQNIILVLVQDPAKNRKLWLICNKVNKCGYQKWTKGSDVTNESIQKVCACEVVGPYDQNPSLVPKVLGPF